MKSSLFFFGLVLLAGIWFIFPSISLSFDLSPSDLNKWLKERKDGKRKFILIDVRTPEEFRSGHIPGTDKNIPHTEIERRHSEIGASKDDTIVVYCRSGRRSEVAKKILEKLGYKNVLNAGGIKHWLKAGFPVEK